MTKVDFKKIMISKHYRSISAIFLAGFGMWVTAGLWHNLILPIFFPANHASHEGILIGLLAYMLLAGVMVYLYPFYAKNENNILKGFVFGMIIGFLWVFPHGLALAGTHDTSILYEVKNGIYHLFEQGIGGMVVSLVLNKTLKN